MNDHQPSADLVLDRHICGYHRYMLNAPAHLIFASQNLCDMLGLSRDALMSRDSDAYAACVHPEDQNRYHTFLQRLADGNSDSAQYRLLRADGSVLQVSDTVTVMHLDDGTVLGDSVLTDITHLYSKKKNLDFLNTGIPCGFLCYTCSEQPRVTTINDQMIQLLRLSGEDKAEDLAMYRNNPFLLIPIEERRRFAHALKRVKRLGVPVAGELTVQRADGSKARLFGWVSRVINEHGEEEFQSLCMDITAHFKRKQARDTRRYINALTKVYDRIFTFDTSAGTVTCLHSGHASMFRLVENIPLPMEETVTRWINKSVALEDRDRLTAFLRHISMEKPKVDEDIPPVVLYHARSADGSMHEYSGLFIGDGQSTRLFCCRQLQPADEAEQLRSENSFLRDINESMQRIVMDFTDGLASFEVVDGMVTPLFASENVCDFFGYNQQEWLVIMKQRTPIEEFIKNQGRA